MVQVICRLAWLQPWGGTLGTDNPGPDNGRAGLIPALGTEKKDLRELALLPIWLFPSHFARENINEANARQPRYK